MKLKPFKNYIIFEDENLIVINKPAGVSSLQHRGSAQASIQDLAQAYNPEAQLCHRLDIETSGILILSKNSETYRAMAIQFENRTINKTYWAISTGRHYFKSTQISLPLSVTSKGKAKVDKQQGKEAITEFTTLENFKHFTLIEARPTTGRLHQIRIHLAQQNAPISGDTQYGGERPYLSTIKRNFNLKKDSEERPVIGRVALHAQAIEFMLNEKKYALTAPLPKDFDVLLKLLHKYDS